MEVLLEFNSVCVSFNKRQIIDNLNFSLKKGEVIALLGPSGCGKTTILNITSGLLKETDGSVTVHTQDFGYVFQEPRLIPWRTVIDNVLFVMKEKGKVMKRAKALSIIEKVGLGDCADYYPAQLSGGMKQRVSIARALAADAKMILMDEPFSALDTELKRELQDDFIKLIDQEQTGVIYVTHDPIEALKLADKILVLSCNGCSINYEMNIARKRQERDYHFIKQSEIELRQWVGGI
jgi:ABC-type nitrate/sulfonate/bicarbonate transport system ATPase subunit